MIFRSPTLMNAAGASPDGLLPKTLRGLLARLWATVFVVAAMFAVQPRSVSAGPLFAAPFLSFDTGQNNGAIAIGDLDGDGNLDMAITNYAYDGVSVLLGRGDGTFGPRTQVGAGRYPYDSYTVAMGDLNGDGRPDLVTATGTLFNTDTISVATVYLGNGDGTFGSPRDFVTGLWPDHVVIGDVNGDGKQDLVTANSQGSISVLLGTGDGTFGPKADYVAGTYPQFLSMADLNGDGKLDVAVSNSTSNMVSVLLGNGDGSFGDPSAYAAGSHPYFVQPGDLNGDGKPDLAITNYEGGSVSLLFGNGDGTFGARNDLDTGMYSYPGSVAIADVDGDHVNDLVVVTVGSFSVTTYLGQGNGIFSKSSAHMVGYLAGSAVLGDLNRDGKLDVALTTENSATVVLGNGDGTFGVDDEVATGTKPSSVVIGDFNGDSQPDLAVANQSDNTVSILLGNGAGKFPTKSDYTTGTQPSSMVTSDFNGDGRADLAVTDFASNSISVLMGNGDGTFGPKTDYVTGPQPFDVAVGDLNGDGKADLVTTNGNGYSVSVFLGRGDGTFSPRNDFIVDDPFYDSPISVAIGDLNSDGKLDLAVTTDSWTVSIMLGNGDGSFNAVSATYPTSRTPNSIAIGDLNGDGKPDLVETNLVDRYGGPGNVSVRLGNGDGTFGGPVSYGTGVMPASVAIADLNGDGKLDLAVANQRSYSTSVFLGKGDGTFPDRTDYGTGQGSSWVAIGDLNRDGKPDLAVANASDNTVSLLMNQADVSTPALAALVSAEAKPGRVSLRWYMGVREVTTARIYRRVGLQAWTVRGDAASDAQGNLSYEDTDVEPATMYGYCLGIQSGSGEVLSGDVSVTVPATSVLSLEGAQPNPVGKDLFVSLSLPDDSPAHLEVFDVAGRRVLNRQLNGLGPGRHLVAFSSSELRSGVYVVRLQHGGQSLSTRAVVVH